MGNDDTPKLGHSRDEASGLSGRLNHYNGREAAATARAPVIAPIATCSGVWSRRWTRDHS